MTTSREAPSPTASTRRPQLADFRDRAEAAAGRDLGDAVALHDWSVTSSHDFWRLFLDWAEPAWEGSAEPVCTSDDVEAAVFFPQVRLNHAENLLRPLPGVDDDAVCLTAVHGDGSRDRWTRRQLREEVDRTATALAGQGLGAGDRVVVVAPNNGRAVVAALATAALGAPLSSGMPDMGPAALLGRFTQVEPVLLALDRTGATGWDGADGDLLDQVVTGLPTVRALVVLDDLPLPALPGVRVLRLADLLADVGPDTPRAPWPRGGFNDPLFVMFSSGTTGPPKAMVHGVGGTLLEHLKEHRLHGDLDARDTLYFQTTTAWMMWNWQLSALAVGAAIVLYDGPVLGPETLWQLAADERVTVFGTSPAHLQLSQDTGLRPAEAFDLSRLRAVLSTGSVLHDWQFDWFADAVGPQPLQSISGGTDIIGCFVLGHPELPVVRGRSQALSLGLDVAALDADGRPVLGHEGELVCRRPFPSRPVRFLRDPDGSRLHDAYYAQHPGVWTHGDVVDIAPDGTARVHGRSDGVLNIDGIRIGPAEIYRILKGLPEIAQSVAVEQRSPTTPGATRLVLLVQLHDGAVLDGDLERRIRTTLRREATAAHVPALVLAVPEVPLTHSGKVSEKATRDTVNGDRVANADALRNPGSLASITAALRAAPDRVAPPVPAPRVESAPSPAARATGAGTVDAGVRTAIAGLWQELGVTPHAGIEDFFDLGGTSRQSMTLLRRLKLDLDADVSMEQFLADPTVDGLAATVATASGASAMPLLAAGDPAAPPLFLLNDAWGEVEVYRPLAELLVGVGPVYGVRAELVSLDGRRKSIDELADEQAGRLADARPEGALRLVGFSFGGLVAFETARRLRAAGRQVEFLGLLDPLPPEATLPPVRRRLHRLTGQVGALIPGIGSRPVRAVLRQRFRPETRPADQQALDRSEAVYAQHVLQHYDGPVTYFRARRRIPVTGHFLSAWRSAAPRLRVVSVPGPHHDLLADRHVVHLAVRMSLELRRVARAATP
ncbi:acetoacetate--CoA ligase [Geodermatophilus sp. CPCC 206100]|uniref:acetoacetate--CoA ligase n=1 Tax=Geodermatophilus sp. CPCC 206100 TaxID=3020054 RepID=UPI003AFF64BB